MQSESSRDLVLNFYQAFDDRQIEQALDGLSPNFVAYQAGVPEPLDVEGFKKFGMAFYLAFSQGQHVFDEIIMAGDRVVVAWVTNFVQLGSEVASSAGVVISPPLRDCDLCQPTLSSI